MSLPSDQGSAKVVAIVEPASKRPKRQIVESLHLSTLLASYNNHFAKYSEKNKNVTQLIPKSVWAGVYKDFIEVHPNSGFQEETLKVRVRDDLKSQKTGRSDEANGKAELQSSSALEQLKMTPGHAKRNVIKERAAIVSGQSLQAVPAAKVLELDKNDAVKAPGKDQITKAQMLATQSASIHKISNEIAAMRQERRSLNREKFIRTKLANLQTMLTIDAITPDEMKAEVKKLSE